MGWGDLGDKNVYCDDICTSFKYTKRNKWVNYLTVGEFYEFYTAIQLLSKNNQHRMKSGRYRGNKFSDMLIILGAG